MAEEKKILAEFLENLDSFELKLDKAFKKKEKADSFMDEINSYKLIDREAAEIYEELFMMCKNFITNTITIFKKANVRDLEKELKEIMEQKEILEKQRGEGTGIIEGLKSDLKTVESPKKITEEKSREWKDLLMIEQGEILNELNKFLEDKNKRNLLSFNAKKLSLCIKYKIRKHQYTIPFILEDLLNKELSKNGQTEKKEIRIQIGGEEEVVIEDA